MPDIQTIEPIELVYKNEHVPQATRNGNNVAWMCWCESRGPLFGGGHGGKDKPVDCPNCGCRYEVQFGESGELKNKPVKVFEI